MPFLIEVTVLDLGKEAEVPLILEPGLLSGVLLITDLLADETMEILFAEALFKKILPGVSMDFFDSAARAALAAVGRLKRAVADSWPVDLTPFGSDDMRGGWGEVSGPMISS